MWEEGRQWATLLMILSVHRILWMVLYSMISSGGITWTYWTNAYKSKCITPAWNEKEKLVVEYTKWMNSMQISLRLSSKSGHADLHFCVSNQSGQWKMLYRATCIVLGICKQSTQGYDSWSSKGGPSNYPKSKLTNWLRDLWLTSGRVVWRAFLWINWWLMSLVINDRLPQIFPRRPGQIVWPLIWKLIWVRTHCVHAYGYWFYWALIMMGAVFFLPLGIERE